MEDESAQRNPRREDAIEPSGVQSPERGHTVPSPELTPTGCCTRTGSAQRLHTELDSDVSDDADQDLDIEDDTDTNMDP